MVIKDSKGFLSIDFLFSVVFLLMLTANFFAIYESRYEVARGMGRDLHGKMLSHKLAGSVNNVYASDGALSVELEFPEHVFDENYWLGFNRESTEIFIAFENSADNNPVTGASVFSDIVVGMEEEINTGTLEVSWEDNIFSLTENSNSIINDLSDNQVHDTLSNKFDDNEKTLPLSENVEVQEIRGGMWELEDFGNDYTYVIEEKGESLEISWKEPKIRVDEK